MSKELPYFRFTVSEWMNGDISMEQMEDQGVFINVCAFYWFKDCSLALAKLKQKFSNAEAPLNRLLNSEIIKVGENDNIIIEFLDEQYYNLSELHDIRSKAGRKGGLSKPKAKLKQKRSYKDKDKDNNKDKDKDNSKFDLIFEEFIKMRIKIRKPLTEKAKELILKKLDKLTDFENEKILILEQSIENSWQGVFPLKENPAKLGNSADENYKYK